jgi:hypothetical protein
MLFPPYSGLVESSCVRSVDYVVICWSSADWNEVMLLFNVIMLFPRDQALVKRIFQISLGDVVICWSLEDWSEVMKISVLCGFLMLISRHNALISGNFLRSVADVVMCWSLGHWSERVILCVVVYSYDVVSSWLSLNKEEFCEICWRCADLLMLRRLKWSDDIVCCYVQLLCSFLVIEL